MHVVRVIYINTDYQHEQHTVHLIVYHIIWCPKRRRKILIGKVAERLEHLICEVANEHAWEVLRLSIQPDHVHLFLKSQSLYASYRYCTAHQGSLVSCAVAEECAHLKRMPSLWTRSTFYSTAGNVSAEVIEQYIKRQGRT